MTYLLDTMIVSFFFQAGRASDLSLVAKAVSLAVVDEVRVELRRDSARGGPTFDTWLAESKVGVRPITVGSPAAMTLLALQPAIASTRGVGERASIALAVSDPSLTLVTHDKGALWIGLRELWTPGERIVGLASFLRRMVDCGALTDPNAVDDVVSVAGAQIPTWWASWRSALSAQGVLGPGPDPLPSS